MPLSQVSSARLKEAKRTRSQLDVVASAETAEQEDEQLPARPEQQEEERGKQHQPEDDLKKSFDFLVMRSMKDRNVTGDPCPRLLMLSKHSLHMCACVPVCAVCAACVRVPVRAVVCLCVPLCVVCVVCVVCVPCLPLCLGACVSMCLCQWFCETEAEFQRFVQVIARPACVSPIDHTQSMPQQHVEAYLSAHRSPQVSIW